MRVLVTAIVSGFLAICAAAHAADIPGSKDPPGYKRYEGSSIVHALAKSYVEYKLNRDGGWDKTQSVEGAFSRTVYLVPPGPSPLEVFRNYEQMLSGLGYAQTFEVKGDGITKMHDWWFDQFFQTAEPRSGLGYPGFAGCCHGAKTPLYATYGGTSATGQTVSVALFVADADDYSWGAPDFPKAPLKVQKGQVVAALDIVTSKAIENKMVTAADMADALATKGFIALYGVYFDTDKTNIKPESTKTLDEVASLLKIDRSLRLEISGHTDNTGAADHNQKLSEGRAQAVVDALVKSYGIDPGRLQAKGYGATKPVASNDTEDGRAKNRRVELRKL
jgi:outer membrane protein OmpA-like peptidoglycan-associated protein